MLYYTPELTFQSIHVSDDIDMTKTALKKLIHDLIGRVHATGARSATLHLSDFEISNVLLKEGVVSLEKQRIPEGMQWKGQLILDEQAIEFQALQDFSKGDEVVFGFPYHRRFVVELAADEPLPELEEAIEPHMTLLYRLLKQALPSFGFEIAYEDTQLMETQNQLGIIDKKLLLTPEKSRCLQIRSEEGVFEMRAVLMG